MTLQTYLTAREVEIMGYEDTPRPVIAKLQSVSFHTVKAQRANIRRKTASMPLSPRERDVLAYCARGYENKEIARALHRTESTVKAHKSNIRAKLGEAGYRREVFKNG